MLPKMISFRKSLEQRRDEYQPVFSAYDGNCKNIFSMWAFELELVIDSNVNWQALWQLSEESCNHFKTLYPTTVIVRVIRIAYEELTAAVEVEAVQDDIAFPEVVHVPLFELFPVEEQHNISYSVTRNIADWLDRCRFFFLYLWYPWDNVDDSSISMWAEQHLENRLKLQYDIRNGIIDKATAHYVQSLMTEALQVVDAIEYSEEAAPSTEHKLSTIKNLIRKEVIKLELALFEAPELREPLAVYIEEKNVQEDQEACATLILAPGCLQDLDTFVKKTLEIVDKKTKIAISTNPQNALKAMKKNCGLVLLSSGTHRFTGVDNMIYGGVMRGVSATPEETVVTPGDMSPRRFIFITCFGTTLFENLTIDRNEGVEVSISEGTLRMVSCCLVGRSGCLTRGIVVQPGCRLEMVNCKLIDLGTGIIAKKFSSVHLESTSIQGCGEGFKVMEGVSTTFSNVTIEGCSVAGIVLESSEREDIASGPLKRLDDFPGLSLTSTRFENNKVDAFVNNLPEEKVSEL